jgi:hypothetical protein
MKKYFLLEMIAIILVSVVISGCNRSGKKVKGVTSEGKVASVEIGVFDPVKVKDQIVEVIQKSPKAIEIVDLLNKAGASYIYEMTIPVEDIEKMMTSTQKALGLGMYGFDGKYASVYNRSDINLKLVDNLNRLITELGMQDELSFAKQYSERILKNKSNPDSIDFLVTQELNDYHQHMKTSTKADVYALSIIGANIEALYVLSQITMLANDKSKLLEVMNNQNERVQTLDTLLEIISGDENVKPYYEAVQPVIRFFEERTSITVDDLNTIAPLIEKARNSVLD